MSHDGAPTYTRAAYNIIRGNTGTVTTHWDDAYNSLDLWLALESAENNLIEDNTFTKTGGVAECWMHFLQAKKNIFRRNTIVGGEGIDGYPTYSYDHEFNMFYSNTFYMDNTATSLFLYADYFDTGGTMRYDQIVNNIGYSYVSAAIYLYDSAKIYDNVFRNNDFYDSGYAEGRVVTDGSGMDLCGDSPSFQADYSDEASGNICTEPTFIGGGDYSADDGLALQVDAGTWLTTITTATGSGTTFSVDNPYFFFDGYGHATETGDVIKTENGQTATITSVNHGTGQIIVSSSIGWIQNEGLALDYSGTAPDIGAEEYGGASPVTLSDFYPPNAVSSVPITADLTWANGAGVTDVDVYFDDNDCSTKVIDGLDVETYVIPGNMAYEHVFTWKVVANPDTDNISYPPTGCYTFETTSGPPITPDSLGSTIFNTNAGDRKYNVNAGDTKF